MAFLFYKMYTKTDLISFRRMVLENPEMKPIQIIQKFEKSRIILTENQKYDNLKNALGVDVPEMFYIRNERFVGNALCWWEKGNRGYTTDINKAGIYHRAEAEKICKREQDTAFSVEYIDTLKHGQKLIIDSQYVDYEKALFVND